jgi:hypothetical protein
MFELLFCSTLLGTVVWFIDATAQARKPGPMAVRK